MLNGVIDAADLEEAQTMTAGAVLWGHAKFLQNRRGRKSWSRQVTKVRRRSKGYVLEIHTNHQF
jgi:hypothetical protein